VLGLGIGGSLVFGLSQLEVTRRLLASFIDAGDGPSQEERDKSWFRLRFIARHAGDELHTEISGGDPGYGETAKMMSESALCLAEDRDKLPARAGVLTPAVAFGDVLIHRLVRAGMSFRVLSQ
jgi:saccharopine dehydrogenase (NAD+, L-glutamate forming)